MKEPLHENKKKIQIFSKWEYNGPFKIIDFEIVGNRALPTFLLLFKKKKYINEMQEILKFWI